MLIGLFIFTVAIIWMVISLSVFVIRAIFGGIPPLKRYNSQGYPDDAQFAEKSGRRRRKEGDVNIDYVPQRQNPEQQREEAMRRAAAQAEDVNFEITK